MTPEQFKWALGRYTQLLVNGTLSARLNAESVILKEHTRLFDGISNLIGDRDKEPTRKALAALLQADNTRGEPWPMNGQQISRIDRTPVPIKIVYLGEETGHIDGLPTPAPRWLPGDTKPATPGIYPTKIVITERGVGPVEKHGRSYWTGQYWGVQRDKTQLVNTDPGQCPSAVQRKVWIDERLDA